MTTASHTPGPWGAYRLNERWHVETLGPDAPCDVAKMTRGGADEANANLIAAAPDLKTSLAEMLNAYWGEGDGDEPPEFIKRAQAAIAKATGATS